LSYSLSSSGVVFRRSVSARRVVKEVPSPPPALSDSEVDVEMSAPSNEETNGELKEPLKSILNLETVYQRGERGEFRDLGIFPSLTPISVERGANFTTSEYSLS